VERQTLQVDELTLLARATESVRLPCPNKGALYHPKTRVLEEGDVQGLDLRPKGLAGMAAAGKTGQVAGVQASSQGVGLEQHGQGQEAGAIFLIIFLLWGCHGGGQQGEEKAWSKSGGQARLCDKRGVENDMSLWLVLCGVERRRKECLGRYVHTRMAHRVQRL